MYLRLKFYYQTRIEKTDLIQYFLPVNHLECHFQKTEGNIKKLFSLVSFAIICKNENK